MLIVFRCLLLNGAFGLFLVGCIENMVCGMP